MIYLVSNQQQLFESDNYKVISVDESFNIINEWSMCQLDTETSGE